MDESDRTAGVQPSNTPQESLSVDFYVSTESNQPSADPSDPDETKQKKINEINPQDIIIDADTGNQSLTDSSGSGPDETMLEEMDEKNPQDKVIDADASDQPSADSSGSDPDETKRKKIDEKNPHVKLSESESTLMGAEASNTLKSSTRSSSLVPEEKENNEDPEILEEIQQRLIRLASSTYRVNDEELRKLIKTQPINKVHLLQFLCTLDYILRVSTQDTYRSVTPQKSSQNKASSSGSWWSWSHRSSQPPPPVKVHPFVTGRTFGADGVILQCVSQRINVVTTNEHDCDFIIVFCPIKSRVGSDVEAAMRKTPGDKPVILVVMHYTRDVDFSVDIKKWSDTYNKIKLEVHVLYHETQRGLLTCPRNDGAIQQLQKLLGKHRK